MKEQYTNFRCFQKLPGSKTRKKGQKKTEHRKTIFYLAKSTFFIFSCSNFRTCVWKKKLYLFATVCCECRFTTSSTNETNVKTAQQNYKIDVVGKEKQKKTKQNKERSRCDVPILFCSMLMFFQRLLIHSFFLFLIFFHNFVIASWTQWKHQEEHMKVCLFYKRCWRGRERKMEHTYNIAKYRT